MQDEILNIKMPIELEFILKAIKSEFKLALTPEINQNKNIVSLLQKHRLSSIIPQLFLKELLSSEMFIQIDDFIRKARLINLTMLAEIVRLSRRLNESNIKYIILKGAPLSKILFNDPLIRHAKDIDIWIQQSNLDYTLNILYGAGYRISNLQYNLEGFKRDYYLKHRHDISLFNHEKQIEVEIHFQLSASYYDFKFFDINDTPLISMEFSGTKVMLMDHNYHFLYLILHGSKHAWFRLKWLYDIYLYLKTDLINLPKVFGLSKQLNSEVVFLQTLFLLKLLFDYENEETKNILAENMNRAVYRMTKMALKIIISKDDVGILDNPLNKTALRYRFYLFYMTMLLNNGFKLQYLIGAFFQIDILFEKYTFKHKFMYYLIYPFEIVHILIKHLITRFKK